MKDSKFLSLSTGNDQLYDFDTAMREKRPYVKNKHESINTPNFVFFMPLVLPLNQPSQEQKALIISELNNKQEKIEELENELVALRISLPDEKTKIEQALYRNPLETIAVLLMLSDKVTASLQDVEDICKEKTLEVLSDCIKNDMIQEKDGKLILTSMGIKCINKWKQMLD